MKALLGTLPQVVEIREAADGLEAVCCVAESLPNLVLTDVRMPEMDGLAATRLIKESWPQVKVIVLSIYAEYQDEALAVGADAFISKGEPPENLLKTLSTIVAGQQSGTL